LAISVLIATADKFISFQHLTNRRRGVLAAAGIPSRLRPLMGCHIQLQEKA
jgi:hypothetical protein